MFLRGRLQTSCLTLSLVCLLTTATAAAQGASTSQRARELSAEAATQLKQAMPGVQIDMDSRTGFPRSVRGLSKERHLVPFSVPAQPGEGPTAAPSPSFAPSASPTAIPEAGPRGRAPTRTPNAASAANAFFDRGAGRGLFPRVDGKEDRRVIKSKVDPDFPENSVVEVQQTYGNLDVLFARSKLNIEPSAAVSGLTSSFTPLDSISIEPAIDETKARGLARTEYQRLLNQVPDGPESQIRASEGNAPLETARLVVFDPKLVDAGEGRVRLAWLVQIGNAHLVIDANSGKTLYFYNDAPSVLIQRIFDFEDGTIAPSSPVLDDAVAAPNVTLGVDVGMARDNTKVVYNFLRASFNRDGFDDNDGDGPAGGSPFISYVRLPDLQNARWCPRPGQQCPAKDVMVYGIGYAAALDIVAHEIGHGVIEKRTSRIEASRVLSTKR
jgi:Zn-dependent metalloprotease